MAERSVGTDRGVEKVHAVSLPLAIVALKKGSHLLKCGRRGEPKFCSFRVSVDGKSLIWHSGEKEKHLKLNTVSKIVLGQETVNFLRQPHPGKESQSFSLVYQNGERSLDLICKDKDQAESWFLGLTALAYASHHPRRFSNFNNGRVVHSCATSPAGYTQRRRNIGLTQDSVRSSEVHSLYGSPPRSDSVLDSSDVFCYSRQKSLSDVDSVMDKMIPHSSRVVSNRFTDTSDIDLAKKTSKKINSFDSESPAATGENNVLSDIFIWGEGTGDILGGNTNKAVTYGLKLDALLPKLIESTRTLDVLNISCGERHAALITKQGAVFCWGEENGGKLGHKANMDVSYPKIVESLTSSAVRSIACGAQYTCAVTSAAELYAWGDGSRGVGLSGEGTSRIQWFPHRICGPLDGIYVSKVACGEWHTAVVSTSGQLYTYGDGIFGVLGHGNRMSVSWPKEVESLKGMRVISVACGTWHTAAVVGTAGSHYKSNVRGGKLYTWGDNDTGRLGHADMDRELLPMSVESLRDFDFAQVSCGRMLTVALTVTGIVFTMGSAAYGQLGNPLAEDKSIAIVEGLLKSEFVKEISCGSYHVAVLTTKSKVYTWGKGDNGRLGLGDNKERNTPCLVEALEDRHVKSVICGSSFTTAICSRKSISSKDQSVCSGCKLIFGFTKKKHNCYNCGYIFCHSCSNKKVINASLAPDKNKLYRVCEFCYDQLQRQKPADLRIKDDVQSPRFPLTRYKKIVEESPFIRRKIFSPKVATQKEIGFDEGKAEIKQGSSRGNKYRFPSLPRTQRWGQVSRPLQFNDQARGNSQISIPTTKVELYDASHVSVQKTPPKLPSVTSSKQESMMIDKMLAEELRVLYAEAKILQEQCQSKHHKLQQYKHGIEETWSLARDEAAKFKAARDFIKVLTNQMNVISEKISGGTQLNSIRSVVDDKVCRTGLLGSKDCRDLNILEDRDISSSNALIGAGHHNGTRSSNDSLVGVKDMEPSIAEVSKGEWIQQDELGVYITFVGLPSGQKGLKRVRFSRKYFNENEAEKWWEENYSRIYLKYNIDKIVSSATSHMEM